jgi:hypothetical protein
MLKPGVMVHACNPSSREAEPRGSQVQGYMVRDYLKSNKHKLVSWYSKEEWWLVSEGEEGITVK